MPPSPCRRRATRHRRCGRSRPRRPSPYTTTASRSAKNSHFARPASAEDAPADEEDDCRLRRRCLSRRRTARKMGAAPRHEYFRCKKKAQAAAMILRRFYFHDFRRHRRVTCKSERKKEACASGAHIRAQLREHAIFTRARSHLGRACKIC